MERGGLDQQIDRLPGFEPQIANRHGSYEDTDGGRRGHPNLDARTTRRELPHGPGQNVPRARLVDRFQGEQNILGPQAEQCSAVDGKLQ